VMAARIASGKQLQPRLLLDPKRPAVPGMGFSQEHLAYVHKAMWDVVNGPGTAGRARLPFPDIQISGKTGTAQVVGLHISDGKSGPWKYRDHGHFISFAPFDNPRYACAVVVEHGGGSGAAYPIARDVMTFLFDPAKAMEVLLEMEKGWGGTPQQRMAARYSSYETRYGTSAPKPADDNPVASADARAEAAGTRPLPEQTEAAAPRGDDAAEPAPPTPSPGPAPSPTSAPQ